MESENWQKISSENIRFTVKDIRDKLFPVLKSSEAPHTSSKEIERWANQLVEECKLALSVLMPFQESEIEFLERLHQHGQIKPELISDDQEFCQSVMRHPSLLWRIKQRVS